MDLNGFLAMVLAIGVVVLVYNYIRLKQEERQDEILMQ